MKNKKIVLITGVTGFIGTHLALKLVKEGYDVYGITKPSVTKNLKRFNSFLEDVHVINCDVSDFYSTNNVLKKVDPDIVVHLAALSPVRDSFEKPFSYINTNMVGTTNIVQAILKFDEPSKKLIYASTAEVYGEQKTSPTKESAPLNPTSPYAITKVATDMYVRMASSVYGLDTTVMRCTNSYGRKSDTSFFVEYLITNMLAGNKIFVGAPNSVRDYMYVDDHVNAYLKAIQVKHKSGEAFNFGIGKGLTNKDVALMIADLIGYDKNKFVFGQYPPGYPLRPIESDQSFIVLDSTKARKTLKWMPKESFDNGIRKTIEYWKNALQDNRY